ncbi:MAG TPA: hypothetical protein VFZ59_16445 [Verrucomicrobiae bacterium]|nr:hypothetical protein [Verrucomicrobiae bacterium]
MNKIAASLGLVALGTTALHAVEATALNPMQRSKPWSVAASLRGFYDDNINLLPDKEGSFGVELSPSVDFGLAGDTTSFNLGYQLNARYYETRPTNQEDHWSFNNLFEGSFAHAFSPRASMSVHDTFVIGNEPDMARTTQPETQFQDLPTNDNIVNYAGIDLNLEVSELLGFNIGYNNGYFNYADDGPTVQGGVIIPSTAGSLNRIDNKFNIDSQWKVAPQTVGILGYMYGQTLYTGDEVIGGLVFAPSTFVYSDSRNMRSQTFYVGAQHVFAPTLSGLVKVGASYNDYYGNPASGDQWTPYVLANLKYQYRTTTVLDFGFSYSQSASDVVAFGTATQDNLVTDASVALLYGTVSQTLLERLTAVGRTTLQYGTYNGGQSIDGEHYVFFQLGLELVYQITPNFGAHAGYTFDDYSTDVPSQPDYNRNRVYIGVTAGY